MQGSSPRVRGKVILGTLRKNLLGIIPACAGKSVSWHACPMRLEDHPRVCGEKPGIWDVRQIDRGIIPACAGKSKDRTFDLDTWKDHPRVCGEKRRTREDFYWPTGSSPRVRGKALSRTHSSPRRGIIPACAGKRAISRRRHRGERDHPRVCGEKRRFCYEVSRLRGSSPRVRGKGIRAIKCHMTGIIPACAGKRNRISFWIAIFAGSSPRVRGKATFHTQRRTRQGIIPACAGKSEGSVLV